mmetsp:Transcript_62235/g.98688  ORF Transcript_62235/g.98688 Transcript_62235/m.98688 type:complete len:140 (+) Transcript_62235:183-602(+)
MVFVVMHKSGRLTFVLRLKLCTHAHLVVMGWMLGATVLWVTDLFPDGSVLPSSWPRALFAQPRLWTMFGYAPSLRGWIMVFGITLGCTFICCTFSLRVLKERQLFNDGLARDITLVRWLMCTTAFHSALSVSWFSMYYC